MPHGVGQAAKLPRSSAAQPAARPASPPPVLLVAGPCRHHISERVNSTAASYLIAAP